MSEQMMRIAGRAGDGTARAVSVVVDANGDHVLRTVDASPFAYDETTETLAVRPKKSLPARLVLSSNAPVLAAATFSWMLTPPVGEIWRIRALGFSVSAPAGATTGTHFFDGYYGSAINGLYQAFSISNAFSAGIKILANAAVTKNNSIPLGDAAFPAAIAGLVCSAACPLELIYTNSTNATQTGTLGLAVVREIEYVA